MINDPPVLDLGGLGFEFALRMQTLNGDPIPEDWIRYIDLVAYQIDMRQHTDESEVTSYKYTFN